MCERKTAASSVDLADVGELKDLEAAAVGEDRAVPAHEAVQAAQFGDQLVAGPQGEVIGVAEDDLGADALRADRASAPLTVAWVPTGMNIGVSTVPCGVSSRPRRARPSVARRSKRIDIDAV